ncbi:MAG: hypothetical protein QG635_1290 [Bacteroidota bacterium]|nr:hypothetical protein [Bacteroidota bacterium]
MNMKIKNIEDANILLLRVLLLNLLIAAGFGCSSIELPTSEQSEASISENSSKLKTIEASIAAKVQNLSLSNDFSLRMRNSAMNNIIQKLAYNRTDDIRLFFSPTRPLIKEEKNLLGLQYTNYVNIDTGFVFVDLKSFKFNKIDNGIIEAAIELEGNGNISVSGKYAGIPASASPDINLYLFEPIIFEIRTSGKGTVTLKPKPKKLMLKAKFSVKLLDWSIPWYQEIPIELTEILQPIIIPITLMTEFNLPLPSKIPGSNKFDYKPYFIKLSESSAEAEGNILEFNTNIDFLKK